ncbi:MAG: FGGY-family carbohydrate kinase [Oscillospiraceae bacterium]|nr:FGGY-family carbohydrate kinase [Oscillospiraceae bacterium]
MDARQAVIEGKTFLGIELGSTRIKAVLTDEKYNPVASGGFDWENKLENGMWTYSLELVRQGLMASFRQLSDDVRRCYRTELATVGGMGVSGMMHGYLVFDKDWNQLVAFRTWRNTTTGEAAGALGSAFDFNIPQRWSIAHLYQAILNGEEHVPRIGHLTTLAGYVHYMLTGVNTVGLGDAAGMFPLDGANGYSARLMDIFDGLIAHRKLGWRLGDILPKARNAGDNAGVLTPGGAKYLDPTGVFQPGIPLCPPEGDGGTGMAATNSVAERTGSVSAGTSIFTMIVLENELPMLPEVDITATPAGKPVAMVHCNNCTSDLDAWVKLFGEAIEAVGQKADKSALYDAFYRKALEGEPDCGGLLAYNHIAGEHMLGLEEGRPLFARMPGSNLSFPNFARTLLFSAMATLKIGMDILAGENVRLDRLNAQGGLFKVPGVGQGLMASALNVPVCVMSCAGEGGAWGIALLAAYMMQKKPGETLEHFLAKKVFAGDTGSCAMPDETDSGGFARFMQRYIAGIAVERAAVEHMRNM